MLKMTNAAVSIDTANESAMVMSSNAGDGVGGSVGPSNINYLKSQDYNYSDAPLEVTITASDKHLVRDRNSSVGSDDNHREPERRQSTQLVASAVDLESVPMIGSETANIDQGSVQFK